MTCVHHWKLAATEFIDGVSVTPSVCRDCGAEKTFREKYDHRDANTTSYTHRSLKPRIRSLAEER